MDQGMLVPDEVVIGMISSKLDENPRGKWIHLRWFSAHGGSGRSFG
jgi:adenylate kinase family enzyme